MEKESKIVEATGTSVTSSNITAQMIEDAMTEAVMQCAREGITDPAIILARKLAARAEVTGQ